MACGQRRAPPRLWARTTHPTQLMLCASAHAGDIGESWDHLPRERRHLGEWATIDGRRSSLPAAPVPPIRRWLMMGSASKGYHDWRVRPAASRLHRRHCAAQHAAWPAVPHASTA